MDSYDIEKDLREKISEKSKIFNFVRNESYIILKNNDEVIDKFDVDSIIGLYKSVIELKTMMDIYNDYYNDSEYKEYSNKLEEFIKEAGEEFSKELTRNF